MKGEKMEKKSIITQTVLYTSILFVATIIISVFALTNIFNNSMRTRMIENKKEHLDYVTEDLEHMLEGIINPVIALEKENSARKLLSDKVERYSPQWMECIRKLDDILKNINLFEDHIVDIALLQKDSRLAYSMTDMFSSSYPYTEKQWFQDIREDGEGIKYLFPKEKDYIRAPLKYACTAVYPVNNDGYILAEIDLSRIFNQLRKYSGETDTTYFMIDEFGNILFDNRNRNDRKEVIDKILGGNLSFRDGSGFYIAEELTTIAGYAVAELDYGFIIDPVNKMIRTGILITALALIMSFGLAGVMTRRMKKPMDDLVNRIASYDGSERVEVQEKGNAPLELMIIRNKFEEMADRIYYLINDVYIAEIRRKEMELQALMNQINPHFLYNVLQQIQTKAVLAKNYEIEEMITSLGSMLHYTMLQSNHMVHIRDEVDYIEKYLQFYKMRFFNNFEYELECEEEIKECEMPKFILQPVVENCFSHGIRNKKRGGIIHISIEKEDGDIYFRVYDNGEGIEEQKLNELQMMFSRKEYTGENYSIGLLNTHARIRLIYGEEYGLSISSQEDEYTEVTLKINAGGGNKHV